MRNPLTAHRRNSRSQSSPDPINQNIEAVVAMHALAEQQVDTHQRSVEKLTAWLGRPQFFYGILVGVSLWMLANALAPSLGLRRCDDPPFFWLQGLLGFMGLLTTVVVLITQNRQGKLAERREQLDMQMSLLVEQRTAKIIELMEELRRDMPNVRNRMDSAAEALTQTVDPHEVLATLEARLEETIETTAAAQIVTEEMETAATETQQSIREAQEDKDAARPSQTIKALFLLWILLGSALLPSKGAEEKAIVPRYTVADLGPVGFVGQLGYTSDYAINSRGQIVGHAEQEAFLWSDGKRISLGRQTGPLAIREDGSVIELRAAPGAGSSDSIYHAFLWNDGRVSDLGPSGARVGDALAMSAQGVIVGTVESADKGDPRHHLPPGSHVALWKNGKMTDLGTRGDRYSVATGINAKDRIIGFSAPAGVREQRGFLWEKGRYTDLGTLPGFLDYAPNAISSRGQIVGWAFSFDDQKTHSSTGPDHAFLWSEGKMTDLGTLGGHDSHAYAVNDAGQVVGTSDIDDGRQDAFLYDNGKMRDLNALVSVPPGAMTSHHLSVAQAINNAGQIVALGTPLNNISHLFLLTPTAPAAMQRP